MTSPLDDLAARASQDDFLGHSIAAWQAAFEIDDISVAHWLGCTVETLTKLRLCGQPDDADDVQAIADRFGVSAQRLLEMTLGCEE